MITRRAFAGGLLAAGGIGIWPQGLFGEEHALRLRFGVISDVHIGGRKSSPERLRFALKWLAARHVDAVLSPGDIAHSGLIREIEQFASIWYEVFPGGRGPDGREVKLMIASGNHDAAASWIKGTDEWRTANVLAHRDNFAKVWERLFHEKFELVWKREVKGYTFIGAQWSSLEPPIERLVPEYAKTVDPSKPFFYCQHTHPENTCFSGFGKCGDHGESVRALSAFPNAVAFTGDSHFTIANERGVWQAAFTSIGAGCLHEGGSPFAYDNTGAFWEPATKKRLMAPINDPVESYGGDPDGGCFELVDVFDDHLRIQRRSSVWDLPIGPDWIVPLPAKKGGPLDFGVRAATRSAPEFAAEAVIKVVSCPKGNPLAWPHRRDEPCVYVTFPAAKPVNGCRVLDYVVTAFVEGKVVKTMTILAAGAVAPLEKSDKPGECLFALKDLPHGKAVTFSVVPRECFGKSGRALVSSPVSFN